MHRNVDKHKRRKRIKNTAKKEILLFGIQFKRRIYEGNARTHASPHISALLLDRLVVWMVGLCVCVCAMRLIHSKDVS